MIVITLRDIIGLIGTVLVFGCIGIIWLATVRDERRAKRKREADRHKLSPEAAAEFAKFRQEFNRPDAEG
jgi:hypothetical protein